MHSQARTRPLTALRLHYAKLPGPYTGGVRGDSDEPSFSFRLVTVSLSVTQSAFASTSDRPLCFPRACVGLIGPRPSDYPHALSACYYFLPAVFLLALGLWSSLPARQLSLDTSYSFLIFSVFFFFFFFF